MKCLMLIIDATTTTTEEAEATTEEATVEAPKVYDEDGNEIKQTKCQMDKKDCGLLQKHDFEDQYGTAMVPLLLLSKVYFD